MARARPYVSSAAQCFAYNLAQTLLEKIKTLYNDTPGLTPDKIGPTVGQNSASQPTFSMHVAI